MVDTNALLSIAFSLIANFTNVVYVPPEDVPQSTNDLLTYGIGSPYSTVEVGMRHKAGTGFVIVDGAVQTYHNPRRSFYEMEQPWLATNFFGSPKLSSNEVLDLATRAVRGLVKTNALRELPTRLITSLAKTGDPLRNLVVGISHAKPFQGHEIPFYQVVWHDTNVPPGAQHRVADVRVDARTGLIVSLSLADSAFCDPARTREIMAKVYKPDPVKPAPPKVRTLPYPATNEVVKAIGNWLRVCRKMGIDPGSQTNLADVDWDKTYLFRPSFFSGPKPACCVTFHNGALFVSTEAKVFRHCSSDFFDQVPFRWTNFLGTAKYRWQDLAKGFEGILVREFGFPKKALEACPPHWIYLSTEVGAEGVIRADIAWWRADRSFNKDPRSETFTAQFDLVTGETKFFGFNDQAMIDLFVRGQAEPK